MAHLPLWAIRDYYPEYFSRLCNFKSYAVCRDPHARFQSAVHEQLGSQLHGKSDRERQNLTKEAAFKIADILSGNDKPVNGNYCVFIPQSHFVYIDGDKIINNVFQIKDLNSLLQDISEISGETFLSDVRHNQTLDFRMKSTEGLLRRLSGIARNTFPEATYVKLKEYVQTITVRTRKNNARPLQQHHEIREFVKHYYKDDFSLYKQAASTPDVLKPSGATA